MSEMTALEWVGAIVAVLVALGILLAGFGHFADVLVRHWDRIVWRAAERRIRERGSQMRHQGYWWATPEQAAVWLACAEHMADGEYPNASVVRDKTYRRHLDQILADRSRNA